MQEVIRQLGETLASHGFVVATKNMEGVFHHWHCHSRARREVQVSACIWPIDARHLGQHDFVRHRGSRDRSLTVSLCDADQAIRQQPP